MTTAVTDKTTIAGLLEVNKEQILHILPKTISPQRFLRICLIAIARSPELQKCTAVSLYAGILQSAQLGLEIGLMNQAHLVPYWNSEKRCFEAQFQIGYLGLRDLGERYGDVIDGDAQAVHDHDLFDYGQGDQPWIKHSPSKEQDRGEITHFYCWAQPKEGRLKVAVMSRQEVEAHRDRFARKKKDGTFGPAWTVTFEAMGLKSVIRKCYKLLARSPELREAIALDEMQEIEIPQHLGLEVEQQQVEAARQANAAQLTEIAKREAAAPVADPAAPPVATGPGPNFPSASQWTDAVTYLWDEPARAALAAGVLKDEFHVSKTAALKPEQRAAFLQRCRELGQQKGVKIEI